MKTYAALLRGINVSGQKIIKMADLQKLFADLGMSDVSTYIQSGNVLFTSVKSATALKKIIESGIKQRFGFDVETLVMKKKELARIVNASPYDELTLRDNEKLYFTLLSEMPAKENVEKLQTYTSPADEFIVGKNVVYILCRKGYGNSVFNNNFIEKILKVHATTRNLATIKKMSGLE